MRKRRVAPLIVGKTAATSLGLPRTFDFGQGKNYISSTNPNDGFPGHRTSALDPSSDCSCRALHKHSMMDGFVGAPKDLLLEGPDLLVVSSGMDGHIGEGDLQTFIAVFVPRFLSARPIRDCRSGQKTTVR